ncbi:PEP-CTERM sorting domain-containing protein [Candidatus Poribacteria bacterium]|nr:PEP-CTERM sorting domain-containing protein [Candidatus Poribacteria bacterium]
MITLRAFSGSETVIDFESIAQNVEITSQFSGLGPTFSGGLFGDTLSGPALLGSAVTASNFQSRFPPFFNPITVTFSALIARVGFDAVTNAPDVLVITTFRSAVPTETITFDTSLTPSFLGIGDLEGIDRIEIEAPVNFNGGFATDNFRFEGSPAVVPEPSSLLLLGVGILAVLGRRRKQAT